MAGGGEEAGEVIENSENNWIKLAAAEESRLISDMRSRVLDEHSHLFRWLTASLLTVNGGAAIAALNSDHIAAYFKILSGICFGFGIIAALLIGVIAQRIGLKALQPLVEFQGYWLSVVDDGERDEALEAEYTKKLQSRSRWAWASPAMGWISATLFLGGLAFMGIGLMREEQASKNVELDAPTHAIRPTK